MPLDNLTFLSEKVFYILCTIFLAVRNILLSQTFLKLPNFMTIFYQNFSKVYNDEFSTLSTN